MITTTTTNIIIHQSNRKHESNTNEHVQNCGKRQCACRPNQSVAHIHISLSQKQQQQINSRVYYKHRNETLRIQVCIMYIWLFYLEFFFSFFVIHVVCWFLCCCCGCCYFSFIRLVHYVIVYIIRFTSRCRCCCFFLLVAFTDVVSVCRIHSVHL